MSNWWPCDNCGTRHDPKVECKEYHIDRHQRTSGGRPISRKEKRARKRKNLKMSKRSQK